MPFAAMLARLAGASDAQLYIGKGARFIVRF